MKHKNKKDDAGKVVGLEDAKRLMDDIPNKIKNNMELPPKSIFCKTAT
jgi:hypothetical protein